MNWIAVSESHTCETRLYDTLFNEFNPNALKDYTTGINPTSLVTKYNSKMNKNLLNSKLETRLQFER